MSNRATVTFVLFLLGAGTLFGQSPTDRAITVTANRNASVAPDQAVFEVNVLSPTDASRDDVLAALQGSPITVANFSSVYTTTQYNNTGRLTQDLLQWTFNLTAPLSNLKSTVAQLTALQTAVAKKGSGISISFSVRGTQTSAQALASQSCGAADLIADARAQAQKMAVAAGAGVGAVVAVSGMSIVTPPADTLFASATVQPSCSLTVKFALTGF